MKKLKDLIAKAQERRMNETKCSLAEAVNWVGEQNVGFIIDYANESINKNNNIYFIYGTYRKTVNEIYGKS